MLHVPFLGLCDCLCRENARNLTHLADEMMTECWSDCRILVKCETIESSYAAIEKDGSVCDSLRVGMVILLVMMLHLQDNLMTVTQS